MAERQLREESGEDAPIKTDVSVRTDKGMGKVALEGFDMASLKRIKPVEMDDEGHMKLPEAKITIKKGARTLVKHGEARYGFNANQPNELLAFYMGLNGKKRRQFWKAKPRNKLHQQIVAQLKKQGVPMVTLG